MAIFNFKKKEVSNPQLLATQDGEVIRLEELNDGVFSQKIIGDGFAIRPISNDVYSPVSGKISQIADTLHAYGITTYDGLEILVHIGLDTVELNGEGFVPLVKEGHEIKAGEKLSEADIEFISSKGYATDTVVLVTNMDKIKAFDVTYGTATGGESVALRYVV